MSQISENRSVSPKSSIHSAAPRSHWLYAFWKFCRPHTVIGTSLSVLGLAGVSWGVGGWGHGAGEQFHFVSLILPLLACLCGNVYIVGLNQLEDIEIDRINKPHLPLASGEFSKQQGWAIVLTTGTLALLLSAWGGLFLLATVWSSLLIGTAYSLPPIRLKRFPVWASLCIFSVRGAIVNLGLFLHFNQQLGQPPQIPVIVWALTLFILGFTFAIAIFKDIPDSEGDRLYHITTFTLQLGQKAVFNLARWVLTLCYLGIIVVGLVIPGMNFFLIATHALPLAVFWAMSLGVDLQDRAAIARFYQFIWKLFYLEYLIFPIACSWHS
ncbi:homogentisate phytyltransferase [Phormidium tenue FACHB-886]|nr:homogentisate phytyltransferase [Phormidium tenue FACHB-886]